MAWELSWGGQYETLLQVKQATGVVPKALLERPKLRPELRPYMEAFYACSRSRSVSAEGSVRSISIESYWAYFQLVGEDSVTRRLKSLRLLQQMDSVYLAEADKKRNAAGPT